MSSIPSLTDLARHRMLHQHRTSTSCQSAPRAAHQACVWHFLVSPSRNSPSVAAVYTQHLSAVAVATGGARSRPSIAACSTAQSSVQEPAPKGGHLDYEAKARLYYEGAWSTGRVTLLDTLMAEDHHQMDMVWQPGRPPSQTGGRRSMKRGILAYRQAYPDLQFTVVMASPVVHQELPAGHASRNQGAGASTAAIEAALPTGSKPPQSVQSEHQSDTEAQHAPRNDFHSSSGTFGPDCSSSSQPSPVATVFVHFHASGTNLGPIRGAEPTGKSMSFSGIARLDFNGAGQICRSWVYRQAPPDEARWFLSQGVTPWGGPQQGSTSSSGS